MVLKHQIIMKVYICIKIDVNCETDGLTWGLGKKPRISLDCAGQTTKIGCTTMTCEDPKYSGKCQTPTDHGSCNFHHSTACYCNTTLCNNAAKKWDGHQWINLAIALTVLHI